MNAQHFRFSTIPSIKLGLAALFGVIILQPSFACTIFVLTDAKRALFCNNEDWSDPKTRIWFVPGVGKHYGAVYVGFDNDYAQGGVNTKGLAFDWVAGYNEAWQPDPEMPVAFGNSGQLALESCANVEEAIAFFRGHQDRQFFRAKILLADCTGASVIIGGKDGKLQVEKATQCRGFGYGARTLDKMLAEHPEPTVAEGSRILRACLQKGQYATKYFNIFDLKSGEIFLFPSPERDDQVKFNLTSELKKGGHYYDMPDIHQQLEEAPQPLLPNMERFLLEKYQPIADKETNVTAHLRAMLQDALQSAPRVEDYTPEAWREVSATKSQLSTQLKALGPFVSMTLVDRTESDGKRNYRYRFEFEKATVLQEIVFDAQNKLMSSETEEAR